MTTRIQASSSSENPDFRYLHQELSKQPTTATLTKVHAQVKAIKQDMMSNAQPNITNSESYQLEVDDCTCLEIRLQIALRKQGIVIPNPPVADVSVSAPTTPVVQAEPAKPAKVKAPEPETTREMTKAEYEQMREQEWDQTYRTLKAAFGPADKALREYAGVKIDFLPDEKLKEMHSAYLNGQLTAHLTYSMLRGKRGFTSAMAMDYAAVEKALSDCMAPINAILQMRKSARQEQAKREAAQRAKQA